MQSSISIGPRCDISGAVSQGRNNTPDPLGVEIKSWLTGAYSKVTDVHDEMTLWHLRTDDGNGRCLDIAQPFEKSESIVIQATIATIGPVKHRFTKLSPSERKKFLCGLQLRLLALDVGYRGVDDTLDRIVIIQGMFVDTMTRDAFLYKQSLVYRAMNIVLVMLEQLNIDENPRDIGPESPVN
jgi:hypothetical protein